MRLDDACEKMDVVVYWPQIKPSTKKGRLFF